MLWSVDDLKGDEFVDQHQTVSRTPCFPLSTPCAFVFGKADTFLLLVIEIAFRLPVDNFMQSTLKLKL